MTIKKIKSLLPVFFFAILLPVVVLAQGKDFEGVVKEIIIPKIFTPLTYLIMGAALVYFLWGVSLYVRAGENEERRQTGRNMMFYGIIALFVMGAVWGLVNILVATFKTGLETTPPPPPKFPS